MPVYGFLKPVARVCRSDLRLRMGKCHDQFLELDNGIGGLAIIRILEDKRSVLVVPPDR
jgi:hypothetical protein